MVSIMENKESFFNRVSPHFAPADLLDIKGAYFLAKYAHRAQFRKECDSAGHPVRYFEHLRRVSLTLIDEVKIIDRDMIVASIFHDALEDTSDLTPDLIQHFFGHDVIEIVKILSKVPNEDYIARLNITTNWKALMIKSCDRLDNLRSLMLPEVSLTFQKKQVTETKEKYFKVFDRMVLLAPAIYQEQARWIRDEIRRVTERCATIIEVKNESSQEAI